jgi:hypothetical protein
MRDESDFELGGRLKARRLRAIQPPNATTFDEGVRTERSEQRRHAADRLRHDEIYAELEIEKQLRGEIASD